MIQLRVGGTAALALAAMLVLAIPAQAAPLQCGDTITQDTKLRNDLINCPDDGIVIGANNVTLNLNGHKIDGLDGDDGVLADNRTGVRIRNGVIQQFSNGILLVDGTSDSVVRRIRARMNDNNGISLSTADANRLEDNLVFGTGGNGIELSSATNTQVLDNTVSANETGVSVSGADSNRLRGNVITENDGIGVDVDGSAGNRLVRNRISNNRSDGTFVDSGSTATLLLANRANENGGGDGDGIDVQATDAATTLTDNTANRNDDLGIEAATGITDGGGNKAAQNANPLQCTGVTCS